MRFILRSLPRVTTACILLTLASIAVYAQDASKQDAHGIVIANMDRSAKPGDDFFEYANGDWIKHTEIPPDRGRISVFTVLGDLSNKRTVGLIEEAAKANAPAGSNTRKIADLYGSYMDEAAIEAKGLAPLRPHRMPSQPRSRRRESIVRRRRRRNLSGDQHHRQQNRGTARRSKLSATQMLSATQPANPALLYTPRCSSVLPA